MKNNFAAVKLTGEDSRSSAAAAVLRVCRAAPMLRRLETMSNDGGVKG